MAFLPGTGIMGIAQGLVGPVSVYCDWVGYNVVLSLVSYVLAARLTCLEGTVVQITFNVLRTTLNSNAETLSCHVWTGRCYRGVRCPPRNQKVRGSIPGRVIP